MSGAATIVHDPSEAVPLCPALGLYLKPIAKVTISVSLPLLPGGAGMGGAGGSGAGSRAVSTWEVMERLRAMAQAQRAPLSALRIARSSPDLLRFEGELEGRTLLGAALRGLDGGAIKLGGFPDPLRVRAAESRTDFPSRHDWDSFFRDAKDMDESLPGERPDTVHLEGLPCRWFAPRESGGGNGGSGTTSGSGGGTSGPGAWDRPSEELLRQAFGTFGDVRHVDIPMLDPYRGEAAGRGFHGFGAFGGSLHFEAYVQYRDYAGFARAMAALRGMKLMLKGEDGKAVACNIKVSFDSTKHLSDASIRKRQLERQKLQELERRREEQKRRERQAEERRREEELKQREAECQERARRREEKLLRREQRQRERERRRGRRRRKEEEEEEQRQLQGRIRAEERKLLLAQRALQSIRLVAELLGRAEAARLRQDEQRRLQEAELRRVEREKERALGLQRRERELRQRLLALLLGRHPGNSAGTGSRNIYAWTGNSGSGTGNNGTGTGNSSETGNSTADTRNNATGNLLQPVLDILHSVTTLGQGPTHTEGHTPDDVTAPTQSHTPSDAPNHSAQDKATSAAGPPTQQRLGDPDPSEEHDPERQTRHDRKQLPTRHQKRSGGGESGATADRREERERSRRNRKRSHSHRHSSSRHGVDHARSSRSRSPRRRGTWHR